MSRRRRARLRSAPRGRLRENEAKSPHARSQRQRLLCKVEARAELACALAALLVRRSRLRYQCHQSFSIFTRNALNSGVLALASPTNGVSAFASQYFDRSGFCSAETPTKPQWIGMPI